MGIRPPIAFHNFGLECRFDARIFGSILLTRQYRYWTDLPGPYITIFRLAKKEQNMAYPLFICDKIC